MATNPSQNSKAKDKLPPQDVEAEKSLLGSLMLDKDAINKVVDFLKAEDFYKDTHQKIYQTMIDLFERSDPIDFLAVTTRLKEKNHLEEIGGSGYLSECVNCVPTASHILHYAKIVQSKRILRDLISASYDIGKLGHDEVEDTDILLDKAEKRIFSVAQKGLTQAFAPLKETLEEAFERIDNLSKHKGVIRGLPTGFVNLDNILAGFQKSDLIILASRPSLGKTSLSLDFARHIAVHEKIPVGIFSLEMSIDQLVDRLIANQANVDLWKIRTGHLSDSGEDNDFVRIQQALGILSEAPIYIDDAASTSVLQMRAMARRLQAEKGLGIIIVDYLQLMEPRTLTDSPVRQVTEISRSLKGLAKELNIPVLALSQLSRAVEQRTPSIPRLADLRESGCLTGETLITRADTGQQISIKELAQRKKQTSLPIIAANKDFKLSSHQMTKVFYSGKKKVFKLKTKTGRTIKASANHPFLKIEGWQRLDQLKNGDCIALPRIFNLQPSKNPLTDKELILLAHLLGDGCILPRQPFHYTSSDKENIKTVKKAAKELFAIKGRIIKQKNWYHLYLPSPYRLAQGKHHPITNWFKKLNINLVHSWEKQIPDAVFRSNQQKISLFLKHLWATDGNLSWRYLPGRKPAGNIYYSTSSRTLAQQVQHLLLRLNIQSILKEIKSKKNYRKMYHLYIRGKEEQLKFLTQIGIAGEKKKIIPSLIQALRKITPNTNIDVIPKTAWKIIVEPIKEDLGISWRDLQEAIDTSYCGSTLLKQGISRKRMMRLHLALDHPVLNNLANSDIFWDQIISIEEVDVEDVYDATVEGAHNFVANDIIVHNSLEQDADVVMFIHRPDRYNPETAEKNIAEIIIAKHRNGPPGKVKLYFNETLASFKNLERY